MERHYQRSHVLYVCDKLKVRDTCSQMLLGCPRHIVFCDVQTELEHSGPSQDRIISIPCGPRPPQSRAVIVSAATTEGKRALRQMKQGKKAFAGSSKVKRTPGATRGNTCAEVRSAEQMPFR